MKWKIKLRVLYNRNKKKNYSGLYYFSMSESEYEHWLANKSKYYVYKKVIAYRLLQEAMLKKGHKRFFAIRIPHDCGPFFMLQNIRSRSVTYIGKRNGNKDFDIILEGGIK